jgi:hypothetical protein
MRRAQNFERLIGIVGRKCLMTPILNGHLCKLADEWVIFDDQYHGHKNSLCRDNTRHRTAWIVIL